MDLLRERIQASGPLRFDEFMRLALYSEPLGYYRSRVPGANSDYRTSPSITPWFGRLVCTYLKRCWSELGAPECFVVVEAGGGNGDLAASVLQSATGSLGAALEWILVEPMPGIAALQQARLAQFENRVSWVQDLESVSPITGVVLANEILDNFPVRLIEVEEDGLAEICVGWDEGLCEIPGPISCPLDPNLEKAVDGLEIGDRFEVITGLDAWCAAAAGALGRGFLLVIDYGDIEPGIWNMRPAGTLVTYRNGHLGLDPFSDPGREDITAHVNFSELERAVKRAGMNPLPTVRQRAWLDSLGLGKIVADLRREEGIARWEGRHGDWVGLMAERSRVETLDAKGGLGDHLVLTAVVSESAAGAIEDSGHEWDHDPADGSAVKDRPIPCARGNQS